MVNDTGQNMPGGMGEENREEGGQFQEGSERAREAGRKGGRAKRKKQSQKKGM